MASSGKPIKPKSVKSKPTGKPSKPASGGEK